MNKTQITAPKRTRRSSIFVVLLFAFIYIGQPALAFVGAGNSVLPCRARGEECCCLRKIETPVASCCSERESATDEGKSESRCDCRVGTPDVPAQDPALPIQEKDLAGEGGLTSWVRSFAELFASVVSGPHAGWNATAHGGGAIGRLLSPGLVRLGASFLNSSVPSAGGWVLLTRGVAGFLAVLSAARL